MYYPLGHKVETGFNVTDSIFYRGDKGPTEVFSPYRPVVQETSPDGESRLELVPDL